MIDTGGKIKYSPVIMVRLDCNPQSKLLMYPNPVKELLTINGLKGGEEIILYNSEGQIVYRKRNTEYQMNIDMRMFRSGMYYIIVTDNKGEKISESKIAKIN